MKTFFRTNRPGYGILLPLFAVVFGSAYKFTDAAPDGDNRSSTARCCGSSAAVLSGMSNASESRAGILPSADDEKKTLAKNVFERFKKFEGVWIGRSTKGWEDETTVKVIAAGSVVQMTSFGAHPNETMLTLFSMDVDRLRLTHYCVAKNQPRLEATSFEDDGRTVTFTFVDGGNLATRDNGHMDKVVYRFKDDDGFTSQWTWYQNGKEDWMEEIVMERKK